MAEPEHVVSGSKIQLLSKDIAELIAAGEVIERPASVIKELVENSIDSGATRITVEIKNGGAGLMRITDDGCGIPQDELPMAFLRHATSKIHNTDDLDNLLTLGFRGEALASIAAVSRVEIVSCVDQSVVGGKYRIEGSNPVSMEETGAPKGTAVTIRDLFFNVPARQKFLKRDVTEGNAVSGLLQKLALSHPEVSFKFIRDGKQEFVTPGNGNLLAAINAVLGRAFADTLVPVEYEHNTVQVSGFTVNPLHARSNRSLQNFFINHRYIRSNTCVAGLEEGYQNVIMTGKFPSCVINLEIPPGLVDVNVHPAKIEVRFSDERLMLEAVLFAVKNALLSIEQAAPMVIPVSKPSILAEKRAVPLRVQNKTFGSERDTVNKQLSISSGLDVDVLALKKTYGMLPGQPGKSVKNAVVESASVDIQKKNEVTNAVSDNDFRHINPTSFKPRLTEPTIPENSIKNDSDEQIAVDILGEIFSNYVLAQVGEKLIIVDKHAAHERFIFEQLQERMQSHESFDSQMLIEPEILFLSVEEVGVAKGNLELFNKLGFCANVDGQELLIRGIPGWLEHGGDIEAVIVEMLDNLSKHKVSIQPEALNNLLHSIACKAAICAGDKNNSKELSALVREVYGREDIKYCPHGRPVMISISKKDLEKQFKRLM